MSDSSNPHDWVRLYGDALYKYALLRVRDASLAEDLVQETFLAALKARESFAGSSSEQTWLTGILKHKLIDHLRKHKREQQVDDIDSVADPADDLFDEKGRWNNAISHWKNPDKSLEKERFWEIFSECISHLPPYLSDLFIFREINGLSSDEVCKVLDISTTNNMWVMLSRARTRLRQCLEVRWFNTNGVE